MKHDDLLGEYREDKELSIPYLVQHLHDVVQLGILAVNGYALVFLTALDDRIEKASAYLQSL